jgi:pyridoxal 5-phosphate dependent beta-lyase
MSGLPGAALGRAWRAALADPTVVHLDAAGSACPSRAVLDATIGHLRREAEIGGYAAEAEAAPTIRRAREHLGRLVGLDGDAVALVPNATAAFVALLGAWPLPRGARVGTLSSEYESNRLALAALADRRGWELVPLPTGAAGRLDLDRFAPAGLDLISLPLVASQRGTVQPGGDAIARAGSAGVPVIVDVAQAAGQVALPAGAAAYVGTARKWLRGPRGTGWLAVAPDRAADLVPEYPTVGGSTAAGMARFDALEGSMAARVGLAVALDELAAAGPDAVSARIAALGRAARARLDGLAGWAAQEPPDEPSGLVTLAHPTLDPLAVAARLLGDGITTSAIPTPRAPSDLPAAVLRVSLHAYCDEGDLDRLEFSLRR